MIAELSSFQNQLSLPDLAELINQEHKQSEQSFQSALLHAKQAGEYLIEARAKIEAEQGKRKFKSWLGANCSIATRTAYHYIKLATHWDELIRATRGTDRENLSIRQAIALLTESNTEPDDEPIEAEVIELKTTPVNSSRIGKGEPSGLPSERYNQGSEDTDPAEEWEDTETRYYNTIPLFNRNDLTEVEEKLRTKYSQADDNICPIWDELIPLFELVGQVMEGEAAAKLQLLPTGDRRRKLPAYIVHRPDLGAPFPLLLWSRENAWQYWQQRRDKLVGLAERKPMSNEFADGFKTDVETPHAPIAFTPEPSGEMPREEHPAGVIASASTCEHYTPEWIWKAALEAFDIHAFDLDPSTYAGSPIPCKQRFIREDDGLSQQWEANYLWSNFPYSDVDSNGKILQVMGRWVDKLLSEIDAGRTRQAMTLVKSDCRPEWFQKLLAESTAFCMLAKAVKFDTPDGPGGSSFFGSVVFYFGEDVERFYQVFSRLGVCCQALEPEFMGW